METSRLVCRPRWSWAEHSGRSPTLQLGVRSQDQKHSEVMFLQVVYGKLQSSSDKIAFLIWRFTFLNASHRERPDTNNIIQVLEVLWFRSPL